MSDRLTAALVEHLCEVQHDAYEAAAVREGWSTQEASRKPWRDVPEANKATMRASMRAVLAELGVSITLNPEPHVTGPDRIDA
jgi:hypothetical protein